MRGPGGQHEGLGDYVEGFKGLGGQSNALFQTSLSISTKCGASWLPRTLLTGLPKYNVPSR